MAPLLPIFQSLSERDAVARMMQYLLLFLKQARLQHPEVLTAIIQRPDMVELMRILWTNGINALTAACRIPRLGLNDAAILRQLFNDELTQELRPLFSNWQDQIPRALAAGCSGEPTAPSSNGGPVITTNTSAHVRVSTDENGNTVIATDVNEISSSAAE